MTDFALKHGAIVLTAPSGSGKTTIARYAVGAFPSLQFSTSATTREPRAYEKNGVHYHFLSEEDFKNQIKSGNFLEYEEVYPGCLYGTMISELLRIDKKGPVLLDIDVRGALRVKKLLKDSALTIFIRPPSIEELRNRLKKRGTESDKWLDERLKRAEEEMLYADKFDHVVLNDNLECAVAETLGIIKQFLEAKRYSKSQS